MKKTRFALTAVLLVTMLAFTGCGNRNDQNRDEIPDTQQKQTIQEDVDDAADDVRDDADDLGDDIRDGVDDTADHVKDAVDGDNMEEKNKNQ